MTNNRRLSDHGILQWTSLAMASMRETAFGRAAYFETKAITERAIRMRDDAGLLKKAEEKRLRKMAKNRKK